ncbi:hypothetical protein, partial [Streptomyces sp. NPDC056707]|uniref:hypothetical protein n=1 Tax=Streptomyces sp. NPDC056707 TaxID=3345919 RepID=UPI0036A31421
ENQTLRNQVREGSPLLAPGVLRTFLRHPSLTAFAGRFRHPAFVTNLRFFADTLAGNEGVRSLAYEHEFNCYHLLQHGAAGLLSVEGMRDAVAKDDYVMAAIALSPILNRAFHADRGLLPALLDHDSAMLEFAIAAKRAGEALGRHPGRAGVLRRYPHLLRVLATHDNPETTTAHWARLFDDPDLLAALNSAPGQALARALAADPELLNEALARNDFIALVKERPNRYDAQLDPVTLRTTIERTGETTIRRGITIAQETLPYATKMKSSVGKLPKKLKDGNPGRLARFRAVQDAMAQIPGLRAATEQDAALAAVLMDNEELLPTLQARPDLLNQLTANDGSALFTLAGDPKLTRALRENGHLYVGFVSDPSLLYDLHGSPAVGVVPGLADLFIANRELPRCYESTFAAMHIHQSTSLGRLLAGSPAAARAAADSDRVLETLRRNPQLTSTLLNHLTSADGVGQPATVPGETLARAVFSDPTLPDLLARRPDLLNILTSTPHLTQALAEHPSTRPPQTYGALLTNQPLLNSLAAHPDQAAELLTDLDLLTTTLQAHDLITALTRNPRTTTLLRTHPELHTLLRTHPKIATDLASLPELATALAVLPGLRQALIDNPTLTTQLRSQPQYLDLLRTHRTLVTDCTQNSPLWQALTSNANLATTSSRLLRRLRTRPHLAHTLTQPATHTVPAQDLQALLRNDDLTRLLNTHPALAERTLTHPTLRQRALTDPGFEPAITRLAANGTLPTLLKTPDPTALLTELDRQAPPPTPTPARTSAAGDRDQKNKNKGKNKTTTSGKATTAAPRTGPSTPPAGLTTLHGRVPNPVLNALTQDPDLRDFLDEPAQKTLLQTLAHRPELGALIAAQPDIAEELSLYPDRTDT